MSRAQKLWMLSVREPREDMLYEVEKCLKLISEDGKSNLALIMDIERLK